MFRWCRLLVGNPQAWEGGRQGTGYFKFKIFESKRLECDCYLLKYPEAAHIPFHTDPVKPGKKHYRLNIIVKKCVTGGDFLCEKTIINFWRFVLFRPDLYLHSVTTVYNGTRYVLSIGWLRNDRKV